MPTARAAYISQYSVSDSSKDATTGGVNAQGNGTASQSGYEANDSRTFGSASIAWFIDHFGMDALVSTAKTTEAAVSVASGAQGISSDGFTVPAQGKYAANSSGTLVLHYHLNGQVNIDWPAAGASFPGSSATLTLDWGYSDYDTFTNSYVASGAALLTTWNITTTINENVDVSLPFHFGNEFYLTYQILLDAQAACGDTPSAFDGSAEGDFAHTATLLGGTVYGSDGAILADPQMSAESAFDYLNPTPEPSAIALLAIVPALCGRRRRP
jgi:hypothetical protein